MVRIEMENGGVIELELYPETAPITVKNFEKLVSEGFYDGLIFHRVIKNFMIQGGGYTSNFGNKNASSIKGEFLANGVMNKLSHTRGVISMARSQHPDSASSQFFICHEDATFLDGNYAAFGKVTKGIEVVDAIAAVETDGRDKPYEDQVMKKVTLI